MSSELNVGNELQRHRVPGECAGELQRSGSARRIFANTHFEKFRASVGTIDFFLVQIQMSKEPSPDTSEIESARKPSRMLRWGRRFLITALTSLLVAMVFTRLVAGGPHVEATVEKISEVGESVPRDEIIVMSVNCAHGRGEGWHQAFTSTDALRANCESIGSLLADEGVDIACLQECDAASVWSGNFDHAATIARNAELPTLVRALNVDGCGLHYGTAVVSRWNMNDAAAHTFEPTPPTFSKGFAVVAVQWPGDASFEFDVVTVHLDFASAEARYNQVEELAAVLRERNRPVIVAGDLNSDWTTDGAALKLAETLNLTAFEPHSDMVTFPFRQTRLDWILVSSEFEITDVEAIDARLSDHRPLRAVIQRRGVNTPDTR